MPSERVRKRIEALLDEADAALARNDWRAALERAKAALAHDPENTDAAHYRDAAERGLAADSDASIAQRSPAQPAAAVPESGQRHPTSFAAGRYTVKKFLGEGGKKKVYLAHDTTLDRDVAFALIKTESLDEAARRRILREAQAMGRLGDHPNIVPIHDLGTESGQPYLVIPFMQGGDAAELIEKAKDHRPPLDQVLRVAKDVCEGLEFAHSKGIVHRDLKPGNVWLTERGQAKIGDFGLALPLDQSRLTREGFMVGTVAYMPPEQAMGGEITARADLYSLGCMLYEMVTGRPPFLGDDEIAIIGQHINTPPVAPTWHRPDCPKPLDALIMRLLAKDPKQRPESAEDVLRSLAAVDLETVPTPAARGQSEESRQGRSLDSMSSGVFVGRHREMDLLRAALEETLSGHGRMVTLVGEPGIGKTRTAQELATYAGLRRCQVLWGRCYEGGGAPPYWPWVQAIRQYVQEKEPEQIRKEMGSSASVVAEIVQDVKEKIPGLHPPPQLENPESSRFRLFDSIASFLKNASRSQSIMMVLDDLHWADKPTLLLLEFVARELANSRVLLVGTYRDVELNRRHPLAVTLGDLTKDRLFERVLLRGLQKGDVAKFVEIAAGVVPPAGLVEAIFTQTEGNPLFVTEVARLLLQEGELAHGQQASAGQKTTTWIVRIPEGVKEVIGRRLDRLSDRCNDILTTAAIIGRRFALPALVLLYSDPAIPAEERLSEGRIVDLIDEALSARIIEELPSGPGRYQFTHALIEESLAGELSTTRKVRLHARIAQVLEEVYGERAPERAAELARHFAEAETVLGPQKIVRYSLLAGEQALGSFAFEEALRHYERAASAKGQTNDSEAAKIVFGLGRAQAATAGRAEIQKAAETVQRAFELLDEIGDKPGALAVALYPFPHFHGTRGITELMERALPLAEADSVEAGRIFARMVMFASMEHGEFRADALESATRISRQSGNTNLQLQVLNLVAQLRFFHGHFAAVLEAVDAILAFMPAATDALMRLEALEQSSVYRTALGRLKEAAPTAKAELELAQQLRSRYQRSWAHANIAWIHVSKGDWKEAIEHVEQGLQLDPDEPRLLTPLIQVHLDRGTAATIRETIRRSIMPRQHPVHLRTLVDRADDLAEVLGDEEITQAMVAIAAEPREAMEPIWVDSVEIDRAAVALRVGRTDEARQHFANLRETVLKDPLHPWRRRTSLWRVALALGELDTAVQLQTEAISWCRREDARAELARCLHLHASVLHDRNLNDDRDRAVRMWDESLAVARELGMRPLIERVIARKKILKA
jgi:predicted ATPase